MLEPNWKEPFDLTYICSVDNIRFHAFPRQGQIAKGKDYSWESHLTLQYDLLGLQLLLIYFSLIHHSICYTLMSYLCLQWCERFWWWGFRFLHMYHTVDIIQDNIRNYLLEKSIRASVSTLILMILLQDNPGFNFLLEG